MELLKIILLASVLSYFAMLILKKTPLGDKLSNPMLYAFCLSLYFVVEAIV